MADKMLTEPLTITVSDALNFSGLGRTKLYEMIANHEIDSVLVGTRRLIVFASLKARLTGSREAA